MFGSCGDGGSSITPTELPLSSGYPDSGSSNVLLLSVSRVIIITYVDRFTILYIHMKFNI